MKPEDVGRELDRIAAEMTAAELAALDAFDAREFYELCQQYRHVNQGFYTGDENTVAAFEALKTYARSALQAAREEGCRAGIEAAVRRAKELGSCRASYVAEELDALTPETVLKEKA